MENILQKARKLNKTLQNYGADPISFAGISKILSEILDANIYIASKKGKVLGYHLSPGFKCDVVENEISKSRRLPKKYNDRLLRVSETNENITDFEECVFDEFSECDHPGKISTIIPINCGGERLGTLLLARFNREFSVEALVLAEYSATIVGMEILKAKSQEIEDEARKKSVVQMAINTLSYSELEAMEHIFDELDGPEGLLVASRVADRVGITRSVIVNALRKFESAGVIESRSLGMKGTYIKVLNDRLVEELKKARH